MNFRKLNWKICLLPWFFFSSCAPNKVFNNEELNHVKVVDLLSDSFDIHGYNDCLLKILKCPLVEGAAFREPGCIEEIPQCAQTASIANAVESPVELLRMQNFPPYYVVQKKILKSNVIETYILSPTGKLISTHVDPRTVDLKLLKKYKDVDALIQIKDKVAFKSTKKDDVFSVEFRMTKGYCLDCDNFAHGNLEFYFSKTNFDLYKVKVKDFISR